MLNLKHYDSIWLILIHMIDPVWHNLTPLDKNWLDLTYFYSFWYNLPRFDTYWLHLIHIDSIWYNLTPFDTIWLNSFQFDSIRLNLTRLDSIWLNGLNQKIDGNEQLAPVWISSIWEKGRQQNNNNENSKSYKALVTPRLTRA